MNCEFCKKDFPFLAIYCFFCGAKNIQSVENFELWEKQTNDFRDEYLQSGEKASKFSDSYKGLKWASHLNIVIVDEMKSKGYVWHELSNHWILKETLEEMKNKIDGASLVFASKRHKKNKKASFLDPDGYASKIHFLCSFDGLHSLGDGSLIGENLLASIKDDVNNYNGNLEKDFLEFTKSDGLFLLKQFGIVDFPENIRDVFMKQEVTKENFERMYFQVAGKDNPIESFDEFCKNYKFQDLKSPIEKDWTDGDSTAWQAGQQIGRKFAAQFSGPKPVYNNNLIGIVGKLELICKNCKEKLSKKCNFCFYCGEKITMSQSTKDLVSSIIQKKEATDYNQGLGRPKQTLIFMPISFVFFIVSFEVFYPLSFFLTWLITLIGSVYLIKEIKHFKRFSLVLILPNIVPLLGHLLLLIYLLIGITKTPHNDTSCSLCHVYIPRKKGVVDTSNPMERPPDNSMASALSGAYREIMDKEFENTKHQGDEFEVFCAFLLEREGYIILKVEGGALDRGTDVRAKSPGTLSSNIAIQCKHYQDNTTGSPVIQKSIGAKSLRLREEKEEIIIDQVGVMTSGQFTKPAIDMANQNGVILIDGAKIKEWSDTHLKGISLNAILQKGEEDWGIKRR